MLVHDVAAVPGCGALLVQAVKLLSINKQRDHVPINVGRRHDGPTGRSLGICTFVVHKTSVVVASIWLIRFLARQLVLTSAGNMATSSLTRRRLRQ